MCGAWARNLAVRGLLALFGVTKLAWPRVGTSGFEDLFAALFGLVIFQIVLLVGVILAGLVYNTPASGFWKGILLPNAIGFVAVAVSVGFFHFWIR